MRYPDTIERGLERIGETLTGTYTISNRSVGLLLLRGDAEMRSMVEEEESGLDSIDSVVDEINSLLSQPLGLVAGVTQQREAARIAEKAVRNSGTSSLGFKERLSRAMIHPITGIPILLLVLYFGLYQFVGVLGAGTIVDFIEGRIFTDWLHPRLITFVENLISVRIVSDLFVGEYGVLTLGLSYAFAIVLPIVGTFFIAFSIIEDSGYLPRLALLIDRVFKLIGLNGRAVIPMVLGFGCDTMATIVTRTQETKKERILTTLLLALAIPCSAQLGVVLGILSPTPVALAIWIGVVVVVFLLVGFLAAIVIPGKNATFYMELPPLRLPKISNVLIKTYARLKWYLVEIIPIFLLASVLLWLGEITGVFEIIVDHLIAPAVALIGLPRETAVAFFFGFFRRDFGAAGLFDLYRNGSLTGIPLVVSSVTLTLFLPCIAQFSIMLKERGWKTTIAISAFIFPFAFGIGFVLNKILLSVGAQL